MNVTKEYTVSTKSVQDNIDVAVKCQITSLHKSENNITNQEMMKTEKKEQHQPDWTVNGIMAPLVY